VLDGHVDHARQGLGALAVVGHLNLGDIMEPLVRAASADLPYPNALGLPPLSPSHSTNTE